VALRVGHMYSSLEIASRNPLLGVGVTNFEAENNKNEYWLNDVFLVNDNPHNGFFYVLSCMGIPALLVFLALVMFPVALLPRALGLTGALRQLFAASLLLILLVSGNFMLHLLSHYFLWLLSGLAIGLTWHQKEATAAAAMPRL
jgi:O-antigen ligase